MPTIEDIVAAVSAAEMAVRASGFQAHRCEDDFIFNSRVGATAAAEQERFYEARAFEVFNKGRSATLENALDGSSKFYTKFFSDWAREHRGDRASANIGLGGLGVNFGTATDVALYDVLIPKTLERQSQRAQLFGRIREARLADYERCRVDSAEILNLAKIPGRIERNLEQGEMIKRRLANLGVKKFVAPSGSASIILPVQAGASIELKPRGGVTEGGGGRVRFSVLWLVQANGFANVSNATFPLDYAIPGRFNRYTDANDIEEYVACVQAWTCFIEGFAKYMHFEVSGGR